MKLFTKFLLTLPISFLLFSCGSTPKVEEKEIQAPEEVIVQEEPEEIIDNSDDVILIDEVVVDETEEEYLRSINNLQAEEVVTKSEFEEDKAAILAIIVMHDAMGVRRETGIQAKLLNDMIKVFEDMGRPEISAHDKLKEFVGHTPFQVLMGSILGIVIALICYS